MRYFAAFTFLAIPFVISAQEPPAPPAAPPPGARPQQTPKNLKILKPEEVRPAMGLFRASLGVGCTGCHVQGDFASDAKPEKEMARKMILMTRQINATFPPGTEAHESGADHVTCFTCHNGASHPKTVPPAPPAGAPAAVRPATPPPPAN